MTAKQVKWHELRNDVRRNMYLSADEVLRRAESLKYIVFSIKAKEEDGEWNTIEWLVLERKYDAEEKCWYTSTSVITNRDSIPDTRILSLSVVKSDFEKEPE